MTIFLCFLAAVLEGADIVSMGLAAPLVATEFGFNPGQVSYVLTATIVGLMVGAAVGGRLGDRLGRKRVLIFSFFMLGIFSLLTAQAEDLNQFIAVRLLCGLGLGAAFPNLIALASEAARPGRRATSVGLMFCGQPIGGTLLGLFVASQTGLDWKVIFYIGGVLPLLLLPLLILALPESKAFQAAKSDAGSQGTGRPMAVSKVLFGDKRAAVTLLLWTSYGFTQVVVYLINNWLPSLLVAKGFSVQQAGMISAFENMGAAAGCVVLAVVADRGHMKTLLAVAYVTIAGGLVALGAAQAFWSVVAAGIVIGFFAIGGQLVLYTLAPSYYPTLIRATGVGSAVAVGRLGGIAGPFAAGKLLAMGIAPAGVLLAATPFSLIAGMAAIAVVFRGKLAK